MCNKFICYWQCYETITTFSFQNTFITTKKETPYPFISHYPLLPTSNPGRRLPSLSILEYFIQTESYSIWSFVRCFGPNFSLSKVSKDIYIYILYQCFIPFYGLDSTLLCRYITLCLSIYKLINIWIAYTFWTILNSTDMNIHV